MNYSKGDIVLLFYPFTDLSATKIRPAVVISSEGGMYFDIFIVPLTSRVHNLNENESILFDWKKAGLNVPTAFKRGCLLIDAHLIIKKVGVISDSDGQALERALKTWLELK